MSTIATIAVSSLIIVSAIGAVAVRLYYPQSSSSISQEELFAQASPATSPVTTSSQPGSPQANPTPPATTPAAVVSGASRTTSQITNIPDQTAEQAAATPVAGASLQFVNLPSSVRSGQLFTIRWQVAGPDGVNGSNTSLKVERHSSQQSGNSSSTSNSTSSQSFGSFITPATFDADFTFSGDPGDIQIEATATINGKTLNQSAVIAFQGQ